MGMAFRVDNEKLCFIVVEFEAIITIIIIIIIIKKLRFSVMIVCEVDHDVPLNTKLDNIHFGTTKTDPLKSSDPS